MGKERYADSDDCSSDNENADDEAEVVEEEDPSEEDPCGYADSDDCSSDNENADDEAEVVEEEEPSEEDPCEEELVEEESPTEEEPSEEPDEEDPSEEEPSEPDEDPCDESNAESLREQEPNKVLCVEGPNREVSHEEGVNEEDPSEEEPEEEESHEEECEELYEEQCEEEPSEHEELSEDDNDKKHSLEMNNVRSLEKPDSSKESGKRRCSRWDAEAGTRRTSDEKPDSLKESGKRRRSRWDAEAGTRRTSDDVADVAKKKSRWSSDNSQSIIPPDVSIDLDVMKLRFQLIAIAQKLHASLVVDERPEHERSPSPPPIYDNLGIKINSREARLRSKLLLQRHMIISELIQKDPSYKPPADYMIQKSTKFHKKLYIPIKEYPEYNFVGLILGPRGNTQKRMEKETGAKILLRGRGSMQEGKSTMQMKSDPSHYDDLHVLIEADSQQSLDAAVAMVEKLLIPVNGEHNVHKLAQLRELAKLNGSLRPDGLSGTAKTPCDVCGNASHSTSSCPLTASVPGAHSNLGRVFSPFSAQVSDTVSDTGNPKKEIDETKIFVRYLPQSVDPNKLIEMFSPYGKICQVKVMMDSNTGLSKGYGFVKFLDRTSATMAITLMNGHQIDGHRLAVRVADATVRLPSNPMTASSGVYSAATTHNNPMTASSGVYSAANNHNNPSRTYWPGPPGSVLPPPESSYVESSGVCAYRNPFVGQSSAHHSPFLQPPPPPTPLTRDLITPDELAHFPGYLNSLDPPSQLHPPQMYSSSSQLQFTPKF